MLKYFTPNATLTISLLIAALTFPIWFPILLVLAIAAAGVLLALVFAMTIGAINVFAWLLSLIGVII